MCSVVLLQCPQASNTLWGACRSGSEQNILCSADKADLERRASHPQARASRPGTCGHPPQSANGLSEGLGAQVQHVLLAPKAWHKIGSSICSMVCLHLVHDRVMPDLAFIVSVKLTGNRPVDKPVAQVQFAEERIQREVEEHARRVRAAEKAAAAAEEALKVGLRVAGMAPGTQRLPGRGCLSSGFCSQQGGGEPGLGSREQGCCTGHAVLILGLWASCEQVFPGGLCWSRACQRSGPAPSRSWGHLLLAGPDFSDTICPG